MIIVLFGQSLTGKSTLAMGIEKRFLYTHNIDDDEFSQVFTKNIESKTDRLEIDKRSVDCGYYVLTTGLFSNLVYSSKFPYRETRDYLQKIMPEAVFVYLYNNKKKTYNYVDDFETPSEKEALYLNTEQLTIDQCLQKIVQAVAQSNKNGVE